MLENFKDEFQPVKVVRDSKGQYVGGEWVPNNDGEVETEMIVRPVTPSSAKMFPDGTYISEDKRFYAIGAPIYAQKDVIVFGNNRYSIKDITDRSFEGNFTIYFSKRIPKDAKNADKD